MSEARHGRRTAHETACQCINCQAERLREPSEKFRAETNREPWFCFEFDYKNRIGKGTFGERVTAESLKNYYRAGAALMVGADFRGTIMDFSKTKTFHLTKLFIRDLADRPPADRSVSRPRVIVAPGLGVFALAKLFEVLGKKTRPNLHVVRTLGEAFEILGCSNPQFQRIGC